MREAPRIAAEALELDAAALYLLEPDGRRFRIAGVVGESDAPEGALVRLEPETLPGRVLADGRAIVVEDDREQPGPGAPTLPAERGIVSALGVPLVEQRRLVGVLQVGATEPGQFGDDEIRFVESLAHLAATTWQRARSDEALRHAQRMESVGELTGGIAHDFNNLLTVIQGNLQVLEDLLDGEASTLAQPLLGTAMRATRRAAELTGKLLAFSRRQVLQPTRVDVAALLQSLAEMLRRTLDQRIEIALAVEPALPACLADAAQLESALLNLAINARDAMPEGGRLAFTARRVEALPEALRADAEALSPPGYLAIAVADTGIGMSEEVRARAFEPFFTTKAAGRGTGLGLSSVYGFAHQSHGGAAIESAPGLGTTVVLYLPQAPAEHEGDRAARAPAPVVAPGLRVLLVEDEPGVRRVAETFLAGWGCRVTPCASAEEALERLAADPEAFDLLLSDVVLGRGMRGSELAPRARALQPRLAVLLMSGYAEGLRAGGDAAAAPLLSKPFTRDELARAIAAITAPSPPPAADRTRKPS
jgi:signal transduction histidine kinase/ActR/RegA family two-component response regulator